MPRTTIPLALVVAGVGAFAAAPGQRPSGVEKAPRQDEVEVHLIDRQGQHAGTAILKAEAEGVSIQLEVSGLPPGPKGIHLHETGSCEPPAFESAGSHLNPDGKQHGLENPQGPHLGDLPNLGVDADGNAETTIEVRDAMLTGDDPKALLKPGGTALVIHAQADDNRTDPSGDSGDRLVCGVIEAAE
jgi:Cu-Zn family superoxide dismutase